MPRVVLAQSQDGVCGRKRAPWLSPLKAITMATVETELAAIALFPSRLVSTGGAAGL